MVENVDYRVIGELENTEFIMNNTFWVGVYPGMTDEMIDYMSEVIVEGVKRYFEKENYESNRLYC